MPIPAFSAEWMQLYGELWNETPLTREGTAKLDMTIEYRLAEDESRAGQFEIVKGQCVRAGEPIPGSKPTYMITASAEAWKALGSGELHPTKAILGRKVKFKGPMNVAMRHLPSLEEAMRLVGRVQDTDWRL